MQKNAENAGNEELGQIDPTQFLKPVSCSAQGKKKEKKSKESTGVLGT